MADRPSDNYTLSIVTKDNFFGHADLLEEIRKDPLRVRILLGGRRLGKSSTLNAVRWTLLTSYPGGGLLAFPVFVDLQLEQPSSLGNLRYILITRLKQS